MRKEKGRSNHLANILETTIKFPHPSDDDVNNVNNVINKRDPAARKQWQGAYVRVRVSVVKADEISGKNFDFSSRVKVD